MDKLISIIVPVYNVEQYIKRCLDSISRQTYKKIEIIVIDDGSKDASADICERCAMADSRIIFIKKENEGAGYTRNIGIDVAKGDYIFFVDSDDYIMPNCIERLLKVALEENADIVKCSWIEGKEDNYNVIPKKKKYKIYSNIHAFYTREMNIAVHGKLYRNSIIGDIRYPKETTYDDEFFTYKLIYNASKIVILDEPYYYYYFNPNSIMHGKKGMMHLQYIRAYKERIDFFRGRNEYELAGISHKELAIRLMLSYTEWEKYSEYVYSKDDIVKMFNKEYDIGRKYANGIKEKCSLRLFRANPFLMAKIIKLLR